MSTVEKEIKKYLKEVKKFLICDTNLKKRIATEIEESIYEYAEENEISDIGQIYERFGTPEEITRTYLNQLDLGILKRAVSIKRITLYIAVTALIFFCLFLMAVFIDAHIDFRGYGIEYPAVEITEDSINTKN